MKIEFDIKIKNYDIKLNTKQKNFLIQFSIIISYFIIIINKSYL